MTVLPRPAQHAQELAAAELMSDSKARMSVKRRLGTPFNPQWEEDFLFSECGNGAQCLVCGTQVNAVKKFNIERHYRNAHANEYDNMLGEDRTGLIRRLKEETTQINGSDAEASEAALLISFKLALLIARSGRSFSDGEFLKECLNAVVEELSPDFSRTVESLSLSRRSITRRVIELSGDLSDQLVTIAGNFIAYSLAFDESTDISNTAQLAIYVRGVDENLVLREELLDLIPMKNTTTGLDILECVEEAISRYGMSWDKLVSVTTDGAPSMSGKNLGFVGRLKDKLSNQGLYCVPVHCIVHQENLCAKSVQMEHVMNVVVKTLNYIRAQGLNHRQFKTFLCDLDCEYGDIPYYSEVRWFSRGKLLSRFFDLLEEVALFVEMKQHHIPQLRDPEWVSDLAFLADLTEHLNVLNLQLQGKNILITNLFDSVTAFKKKLSLWQFQLSKMETGHFPKLSTRLHFLRQDVLEKYASILGTLKEEFDNRFRDLNSMEIELRIFATAFSMSVDDVPIPLQCEILDLQYDREIKDKYDRRTSLLQFYENFSSVRFPKLHRLASKMLCMFGSTYICEQLFSKMKLIKSCQRNKLSDDSLTAVLRITSAQTITPRIQNLVKRRKNQEL